MEEEVTEGDGGRKARGFSKVRVVRPLLVGFCDSLGQQTDYFLTRDEGSLGSSRLIGFPLTETSSFEKIFEVAEREYGSLLGLR